MHLIVVGNPGAGKSTIPNTLLGRAHFEAGLNFGDGLTQFFQTVSQDGNKYSDTPALNSLKTRKRAAQEIAPCTTSSLYKPTVTLTLGQPATNTPHHTTTSSTIHVYVSLHLWSVTGRGVSASTSTSPSS